MDDLWATLDNHQAFSTEHRPTLRSRCASEWDIVSELRLWLLRDFVAAYCRSLAETRIFLHCYWIDGLGINTRTAALDVLEPVIDLAQTLAQDSKPITLRGLILTAGSSKRNSVRAQLNGPQKKQPALPKDSGLVRASWLEAATTIFDALAQSPAIFLLNPLGATAFSYAHVYH